MDFATHNLDSGQPELILLALLLTALLLRSLWKRSGTILIREHEVGVRVRRGRVVGLAPVGVTRTLSKWTEVFVVDTREQESTVALQEVLTADGVSIKASLVLTWRIVDPVAWLFEVEDAQRQLYTQAQLGLRQAVGAIAFDDLMKGRAQLEAALREPVVDGTRALGVELVRIAVKDLVLGGELKRALTEPARARAQARTQLERSRGETAVLRSLVNAAKLIQKHEGLAELRLLEAARAMAEGQGNSLHLGTLQELSGLLRKSS